MIFAFKVKIKLRHLHRFFLIKDYLLYSALTGLISLIKHQAFNNNPANNYKEAFVSWWIEQVGQLPTRVVFAILGLKETIHHNQSCDNGYLVLYDEPVGATKGHRQRRRASLCWHVVWGKRKCQKCFV